MSAWMEPAFVMFAAASFLGSIGLYIPYFYVETFSRDFGIIQNRDWGIYLIPSLNAGSVLGRIVGRFPRTVPRNPANVYYPTVIDIYSR